VIGRNGGQRGGQEETVTTTLLFWKKKEDTGTNSGPFNDAISIAAVI
jgi:hypothetical protein